MEKDFTLFGELALDTNKNQQVLVLCLWENVFADGTYTYAKVVGKDDQKVYSTDFRNLVKIEVEK